MYPYSFFFSVTCIFGVLLPLCEESVFVHSHWLPSGRCSTGLHILLQIAFRVTQRWNYPFCRMLDCVRHWLTHQVFLYAGSPACGAEARPDPNRGHPQLHPPTAVRPCGQCSKLHTIKRMEGHNFKPHHLRSTSEFARCSGFLPVALTWHCSSPLIDTPIIIAHREWTEDGQLWVQYVSSTPATRLDVINLQEKLDQELQRRQVGRRRPDDAKLRCFRFCVASFGTFGKDMSIDPTSGLLGPSGAVEAIPPLLC